MQHEKILILDFGGQYNQLIGRRVRDLNVFCEIKSYSTLRSQKSLKPAIKASSSRLAPNSVYDDGALLCDPAIFELGVPILGICYGAQLMAYQLNGGISPAQKREYGRVHLHIDAESKLFEGVKQDSICWMSHTDYISAPPIDFETTAHTESCPTAAMENAARSLYAVQFHPEVNHTEEGQKILHNFLYKICGCSGDWTMAQFVENTIANLKVQLAGRKVLCAFSGGVDSSVAALLVHKAIGKNLHCIFVDHGLLRKNEAVEVESLWQKLPNESQACRRRCPLLRKTRKCQRSEQKRKIIGSEFIRVFEEEAKAIGAIDVLVQGTIYPDIIESGVGDAANLIKSHHNVGGLPKDIGFSELVEPLRDLFKDEVRRAGEELGIPAHLVWRQPFPVRSGCAHYQRHPLRKSNDSARCRRDFPRGDCQGRLGSRS